MTCLAFSLAPSPAAPALARSSRPSHRVCFLRTRLASKLLNSAQEGPMARGVVGTLAAVAPAAPEATTFQGLQGFEDRSVSEFNIAILGDLHLEPEAMGPFLEAREQVVRSMHSTDGKLQAGARVVQLGDLGSYHHGPGGMGCFERAKEYLEGFKVPTAAILGNHDLEGAEFETDEENLEAWKQVFGQRHFWSCDVGPLTLIGLSTVRFRSNPDSVHEVHVDEEQLNFLEQELAKAQDQGRPVALFTHAPIMGSGLKVVQAVHVKNRCAWLNHSSDPRRFIQLVRSHPCVRLWFSGHFHLSHNYPDSVSVVGGCAFVQTGVIGECNRDGFRQSRVLRGDAEGYRLYTMDHETGELRLDLQHLWGDASSPVPVTPEEELICDPSSGWLCSKIDCTLDFESTMGAMAEGGVKWYAAGPNCMLAYQDNILVEYDIEMIAPLGAVALNIPEGCEVVLVDAAGREVDTVNTDGSTAVAVELRLPAGHAAAAGDGQAAAAASAQHAQHALDAAPKVASLEGVELQQGGSDSSGYVVHERIERNAAGTFYQIFQKNKWRARKEKEAKEAAEAAKRAQQQQMAGV